jgi:demethylmenaquinone methyltransferase / 2-methoxy-6-polyprenyl-1,4-benzoquinol methylase
MQQAARVSDYTAFLYLGRAGRVRQPTESSSMSTPEEADRGLHHRPLRLFGSGAWYRRQALARAGLAPGQAVLDVACGTGVLSKGARALVGESGRVLGLDASFGMLLRAREHGIRPLARGLAEALPFADASFDLLSMGYALRHVGDLRTTFREYRRVLRPGGRLLLLEITPPSSRRARGALRFYLRRIAPGLARIGRRGAEARELMEYYWDTIETCQPPDVILACLGEAGFAGAERHVELGIFSEYRATA